MIKYVLLLGAAPLGIATPALANSPDTTRASSPAAAHAVAKPVDADAVTTGVARARDRLDSATSTSSIKEAELSKLGALSLGEVMRNIPGLRVESASGEVNVNMTIRGLPMASTGGKFLQLQEDGLPVVEFGDIGFATADTFIRPDLTLSAVEAIRGGSASTFTSNAPGGVINMISKTGEREGGAIQATAGLNYDLNRLDFTYGAHINDTLRFNVGGFYHAGEGVRHVGYTAVKGGQIKFNMTKTFEGGFVRLNVKVLDDRTPAYQQYPIAIGGTNANPVYQNLAGFDLSRDAQLSPYLGTITTLDGNNRLVTDPMSDGIRTKMTSVGLESQFDIAGWTVQERFRYSSISGGFATNFVANLMPAGTLAAAFGGPGATLSYATGPNTGQSIGTPALLNGNGLAAVTMLWDNKLNSLNNMTNDLRASRVWKLGAGELTTTAGFYKSLQTIAEDYLWTLAITDVVGGAQTHLLNLTTAGSVPVTQNGIMAYGVEGLNPGYRRSFNVDYGVNAPYGSVNYHVGKFSIGASLRYDFGTVRGIRFGSALRGGAGATAPFDINGNGSISGPESQTSVLPLGTPGPVNYRYDYLSYSTGATYRIIEPLAAFARYSKGGRANADRILFGSSTGISDTAIDSNSGALLKPASAVDTVKQAEMGLKYRKSGLTLNLTGFWAKATDHNIGIDRVYRAVGVEFEGGYRHGPFSVTAGATLTDAKIVADAFDATTVGHKPSRQPALIFQLSPQYNTDSFAIGANFVGNTSSYTGVNNVLKQPGYIVTNAFVQLRPAPKMLLSLNVGNLFNTRAITEISATTVPALGAGLGRQLYGRTITTSLRFDF